MPRTAAPRDSRDLDLDFGTLRAEILAQLPRLTGQDLAPYVPAAIAALGYLRPACADWLTDAMLDAQPGGIEPAVLALRKRKPQLNRAEKRRIGIRSEIPFSRQAFDMLTEKGRTTPLRAFEATADLAAARQAAVAAERQQRAIGITRYVWTAHDDAALCPDCASRNGQVFAWDAPPPGGHPGMGLCCGERHCRCTAEGVAADPVPQIMQEPAAELPPERISRSPLLIGMIALLLLGAAYTTLGPLLNHWR
ncbi:MAG TPA: minor capsid protein [Roseomonas sp.]